jgi:WD40 repeat protein
MGLSPPTAAGLNGSRAFRAALARSCGVVLLLAAIEGLVLLPTWIKWHWHNESYAVLECAPSCEDNTALSLVRVHRMADLGAMQWQLARHHLSEVDPRCSLLWPEISPNCMAAAGTTVAICQSHRDLYLGDLSRPDEPAELLGKHIENRVLKLTPDAARLVSFGNTALCVWDVPARRLLWSEAEHSLRSLVLSADGRWLVCGTLDGKLQWRSIDEGKIADSIEIHDGEVLSVAVTPDAGLAAALRDDQQLVIVDRKCGAVRTRRSHPYSLAVAISPDGQLVASAVKHVKKCDLRVTDAVSGEPIGEFPAHADSILGMEFTDATRLLTWGQDGAIHHWDARRGARLLTVQPRIDASWFD